MRNGLKPPLYSKKWWRELLEIDLKIQNQILESDSSKEVKDRAREQIKLIEIDLKNLEK